MIIVDYFPFARKPKPSLPAPPCWKDNRLSLKLLLATHIPKELLIQQFCPTHRPPCPSRVLYSYVQSCPNRLLKATAHLHSSCPLKFPSLPLSTIVNTNRSPSPWTSNANAHPPIRKTTHSISQLCLLTNSLFRRHILPPSTFQLCSLSAFQNHNPPSHTLNSRPPRSKSGGQNGRTAHCQ